MEIEYFDKPAQTVSIDSLKVTDTFLTLDGTLCMNLGYDNQNGIWEFVVLDPVREEQISFTDKEHYQVTPVKAKLVVEI